MGLGLGRHHWPLLWAQSQAPMGQELWARSLLHLGPFSYRLSDLVGVFPQPPGWRRFKNRL